MALNSHKQKPDAGEDFIFLKCLEKTCPCEYEAGKSTNRNYLKQTILFFSDCYLLTECATHTSLLCLPKAYYGRKAGRGVLIDLTLIDFLQY